MTALPQNHLSTDLLSSTEASLSPNATDIHDWASNKTITDLSKRYADYQVIRRRGGVVGFEPPKISIAITKAFLAVSGRDGAMSSRIREQVEHLTASVIQALFRREPAGGIFHIEDIQDQVELALMRSGEHEVARAYVLYREARHRLREQEKQKNEKMADEDHSAIKMMLADGSLQPIHKKDLLVSATRACQNLDGEVLPDELVSIAYKNLYNGVHEDEVRRSLILAARTLIEKEPDYVYVAARLLLNDLADEVFGESINVEMRSTKMVEHFPQYIVQAIDAQLLDARLGEFDLVQLAQALNEKEDQRLMYLGLQTLYDRYFLHIHQRRIELPQYFFMRVAMGLALNEDERERRAIEFYHVLSRFDFMSSTPTLFNSGTLRPQLSSCYLTTVPDDLSGIFDAIRENALLQKFAGGLGNDWSAVRSLGAYIKGTNGQSQGIIPFLKVVNDTAVAVNQGGKRKGAVCAYLETWHLDIESFLDLRKNTGDERRRAHDMNTAHWIPDVFMKRVMENKTWTLFSPSDVPDLHELTGLAFEEKYTEYENKAAQGEIALFKVISAQTLWRKMLTLLFETGHPWITFKDACNLRSPQQHVGVVHSSNLCTEITLNTSDQETAVCNLGSINLLAHLDKDGHLDTTKLKKTINTAIRMLDNVIDLNYYAVSKARQSNLQHRPIGLGMMGFQDALFAKHLPYASDEALEFADQTMETIAYYTYWASSELSRERGTYSSYSGSLWSQGILPQDTLALLRHERRGQVEIEPVERLDWAALRTHICHYGMRNSNCLAIAPTATISNIVGVSASIEPNYQNLYVKSNLSGEFTLVNRYLVEDLRAAGLWDDVMIADLKYFDGSLQKIDRIPESLRKLYSTAFEIDPLWLVEAAARRQVWIDQAQSLNIYIAGNSGKKLDDVYKLAWLRGLKTTYYLRTLGASSVEKSTGRGNELTSVPSQPMKNSAFVYNPKACQIDDPDCEACQ